MIQCVRNKRSVMRRSTDAGGRVAERTMEGTIQFGIGWSGKASLLSEGGEGVTHEDNVGAVCRQGGKLAEKLMA